MPRHHNQAQLLQLSGDGPAVRKQVL